MDQVYNYTQVIEALKNRKLALMDEISKVDNALSALETPFQTPAKRTSSTTTPTKKKKVPTRKEVMEREAKCVALFKEASDPMDVRDVAKKIFGRCTDRTVRAARDLLDKMVDQSILQNDPGTSKKKRGRRQVKCYSLAK